LVSPAASMASPLLGPLANMMWPLSAGRRFTA